MNESGSSTPSPPAAERIAENLARVRARIADAESRFGRAAGSVRLVAVTKTVDVAAARALLDAGCRDLGENRPEELLRKSGDPLLAGATWHLIGRFQRRKIRDALAPIALVHSVDSLDLLRALDRRALELGRRGPDARRILLEMNLSGEASKQGFTDLEARAASDCAEGCDGLQTDGLMTMAPYGAPESEVRRLFARLRSLRDALARPDRPLPELSMGMSDDFEWAVAEGATIVRIGTALFR